MSKYADSLIENFGSTKRIREATKVMKDLEEVESDRKQKLRKKVEKLLKS